jgi:hypothetical protein
MSATNLRAEILNDAASIVNGNRNEQYGEPENNFADIAKLWSAYLGEELAHPLTASDVAMMMLLLKIVRVRNGEYKKDNYIDIAGYAACAAEFSGGLCGYQKL